jgi:hypothetical protein
VRMKCSVWGLFVSLVCKLFMYKTQTNVYYQLYAVQNAYHRCVLFHMMRGGDHDLCGGVTELRGLYGR